MWFLRSGRSVLVIALASLALVDCISSEESNARTQSSTTSTTAASKLELAVDIE